MRVGCGLRVRRIDGNEYLYFWHYEREGGRSERREDYVGPAREAKSRQEAARKLLVYHRRAQSENPLRLVPHLPSVGPSAAITSFCLPHPLKHPGNPVVCPAL